MAGEQILIQNELVTLQQVTASRQMPLEDFLREAAVSRPVTLPTLGRTQVMVNFTDIGDSKRMLALTEIPAAVRSISKNLRSGNARRYKLTFPWTYLWFNALETSRGAWSIDDYRIYFAKEQYTGLETRLIPAMLPNVSSDGSICWGSTGASPTLPIGQRLDALTNSWYASRFNSDLDGSNVLPYGEHNYARWVRETRENRDSYKNWPEWETRDHVTAAQLIESAGSSARPTVLTLDDTIPDIPIAPSFGRWEEWWNVIPAEQRGRAFLALNNIREDNIDFVPDIFPDTATSTDGTATATTDDGGEEIPYE